MSRHTVTGRCHRTGYSVYHAHTNTISSCSAHRLFRLKASSTNQVVADAEVILAAHTEMEVQRPDRSTALPHLNRLKLPAAGLGGECTRNTCVRFAATFPARLPTKCTSQSALALPQAGGHSPRFLLVLRELQLHHDGDIAAQCGVTRTRRHCRSVWCDTATATLQLSSRLVWLRQRRHCRSAHALRRRGAALQGVHMRSVAAGNLYTNTTGGEA